MHHARVAIVSLIAFAVLTLHPADASSRVPGASWQRFSDVGEAGFDAAKLEAARTTWEGLPSSAFLVISGGAVVASWGDTDRRFMCHSVRKSFLSALYGIYWDRGEIDLNKTLFDLGIDDTPDPLLDGERQARILDLLKARSGIFHPAAYAGRTDSAPRGSKGAGRYFAYNNWDFNTLATILIEETGDDVFESFDAHFAQPLGMEDWRVTDGYYHLERDKSRFPAYPFRMSARDAARFGLLFAREGQWGDQRILSKHWVRRSAALYSIDDESIGYGFMWWVMREPRFEKHGMYAALGVGNQMIAVLPEIDLVIVNRANTYEGESTPTRALMDLIEQVLAARVGEPVAAPRLADIEDTPRPHVTRSDVDDLTPYRGRFVYPPASLGLPADTWVRIAPADGYLETFSPESGTFSHYVQTDGTWVEEDSHQRYHPVHDAQGRFDGIADTGALAFGAFVVAARGDRDRAQALRQQVGDDDSFSSKMSRALTPLLDGRTQEAASALRALTEDTSPRRVERSVNFTGYRLMGADLPEVARDVLLLNTELFPASANAWDSLGEVYMTLGASEESIRAYEKSLELNADNENAVAMIAKMKEDGTEE